MDGCGIWCFRPKWLSQFANTKYFMMVYGLLGTVQAMGYLYFVVTLTTIEKRFKIPSQTTGIILSGNEISQIMLALILSYAGGQRNRPMWIAWGMVFCSLSCFILAAPHFIYGAGEESLELTKEYLLEHSINVSITTPIESSNRNLCSKRNVDGNEECDELFSYLPLILIFISQFVLGIGNTLYFALGQSYLDDNTRQERSPLVLAYALSMRMLGPVGGFILGFFALSIYIDPTRTPVITKKDPRWLGAWWLGWILMGILMLFFSIFIGMFPKKLPKEKSTDTDGTESERKEFLEPSTELEQAENEQSELKDFPSALMRLLKNKLLIFNLTAGVFYVLGSNGYITYLTKYIEVQFNLSSSDATIFTGPITILGMVAGYLGSGYVISKFKPPPRKLFFWNVLVGLFYVVGQSSYIYMTCEGSNSLTVNDTWTVPTECNAHCRCDGIAYSPVCHVASQKTFFSACHAGCETYNEKQKTYSECSCGGSGPFNRSTIRIHHRKTLPLTASNAQPTNEKTLIFNPIEAPSAAQYEPVDAVEFAESERIASYDDDVESYLLKEPRSASEYDDVVTPGVCAGNCMSSYLVFSFVALIINCLGATGRVGNILLNFRAVEPRDKSFSQGMALTVISLFALIPGPILFGRVIDSTCKIWGEKCDGERGNCQLYDQSMFRYYVNLTAVGLTLLGVCFDLLVWHYGKDLDLYGDIEEKKKRDSRKDDAIIEKSSI